MPPVEIQRLIQRMPPQQLRRIPPQHPGRNLPPPRIRRHKRRVLQDQPVDRRLRRVRIVAAPEDAPRIREVQQAVQLRGARAQRDVEVKARKVGAGLEEGDVDGGGDLGHEQAAEGAVAEEGEGAARVGEDDVEVRVSREGAREDEVDGGAGRREGEVDDGLGEGARDEGGLDARNGHGMEEDERAVGIQTRPDGLEEGVAGEETAVRRRDTNTVAETLRLIEVVDLGEGAVHVAPVGEGAEEAEAGRADGLVAEILVEVSRQSAAVLARAGNGGARGRDGQDTWGACEHVRRGTSGWMSMGDECIPIEDPAWSMECSVDSTDHSGVGKPLGSPPARATASR